MRITTGIIRSAKKVVIYGPEGIGKSTFASFFPKALFIDAEGSTKTMDVSRLPKPTSWTMLFDEIRYILANPDVCTTLIIDTIDWAERLCIENVCAKHNKKGIEDFGYGNGYVYEQEEFGKLLNILDEVIECGINIVLTAHAQLRKFEQPDETGAYDRWELKLGKKTGSLISPLVKEWADMVLFANYQTFAVAADDKGKKFKAQGGKRVMYTSHHPCWDAKNRDGLSEILPFEYAAIQHLIPKDRVISGIHNTEPNDTPMVEVSTGKQSADETHILVTEDIAKEISDNSSDGFIDLSGTETPFDNEPLYSPGLPKALTDLMSANGVTEAEIKKVVALKGYYTEDTPIQNYDPGFMNGVLIGAWNQVKNMVMQQRNDNLSF
ncbi:MAG: ATP-binding protein [Oscillospiraceae bacterium]|nr:ATP-binding protein [Oscillospiraceae bacterium]